jgi:hypothetical protein
MRVVLGSTSALLLPLPSHETCLTFFKFGFIYTLFSIYNSTFKYR